ncbi:hypothetical protein ACS0TY_016110 [Phlomoides rotata]
MPNSGDAKCFSGVLSRLLCSGSLPTHPSEQLIESSTEKLGDQKPGIAGNNIKQVVGVTGVPPPAAASPGVVARLMGLESFPTTPRDRTLGAYFRSKSVNSIDFLSYFDPIKHGNHQHRRVRTSVSFHYQGVNDDFASIILHETGENRDEEGKLFIRKLPDVRYQYQEEEKKRRKNWEYFQGSNRHGKNREFFQDSGPGNLTSQKKDFRGKKSVKLTERRPIIKGVNSKEEMVGSNCGKRRRKRKKILVQKIHPTVPEVARSSRNQRGSQTATSRSPNSREDAIITGKNERKVNINESCYYTRIVEEICVLSEEDLKENWIHGRELKCEDFEEIIQEFGHKILDVLLNQFVDELVLLF